MPNVRRAEIELPIPEDMTREEIYWWVMCHMLYPESAEIALGAFVAALIHTKFGNQDPEFLVQLPVSWVRALTILPSFDERKLIEQRAWKDGMTTGAVLSLVYAMHRSGISEPSVNKAMEILEAGKLENVHRGTKEIRKALKRMAPFAHLWAANSLLLYTDKQPNVVPGFAGLSLYLRWAATIRAFGISHQTRHGPKSTYLIDRYECVSLPERFPPDAHEEISLPLPDWIQAKLNDYRAAMKL